MLVLAHQGGWDETLIALGPVALFAVILWIANRRARHLDDDEPDDESRSTSAPTERSRPTRSS